ncbi:2-isopropylmalate synthase [Akkermansiaceae bacterium]|nr:2-isopropylmalate synthase [Akkermansiaceae bacterium]
MKTDQLTKYQPFKTVELPDRQWPDNKLTKAPIWASVDLRDGNQSLPTPMSIEEKLEYFDLLVKIGFKQIEVGFPSASDTEFNFLRRLIEESRIPDDVSVQVLVQAREHLIKRTFESLQGAKKAIVHLYNSTSPLQRKVTFSDASKEKIKDIAVEGAKLVYSMIDSLEGTELSLQYSPESFSDTETEYALEVCEAVMEVWEASAEKKVILNLPATVEWFTPNIHADQIEWFCRNLKNREAAIISLHTHNDRGTGVAATELALLAGADRVEGTLFGNGERTGNLDLVTVALNMNSHGIATGLDFSNLSEIRFVYEKVTKLTVPDRQPYAGELVFTAFSGSHQDAIKKGLDRRIKDVKEDPNVSWQVPYLTIDPSDIGRSYEAIIRINSQSGKGGVAYILDTEFGIDLPKTMHPQVGSKIYSLADELGKELTTEEIRDTFMKQFVNIQEPLKLLNFNIDHEVGDLGDILLTSTISFRGQEHTIKSEGNGPINAFIKALKTVDLKSFSVRDYRAHSISGGSSADSIAYVQLKSTSSDSLYWGAGIASSIGIAGLKAVISAINIKLQAEG